MACDCGNANELESHAEWCATRAMAVYECPDQGNHLYHCKTRITGGLKISRLRKQPSLWSCVPTAFAMVLGREPEEALAFVGGRDDIRGHHPLEYVLWALTLGVRFTPVDLDPSIEADDGIQRAGFLRVPTPGELDAILAANNAVLIGWPKDGNETLGAHAVAWFADERMVYDPKHAIYPLEGSGFELTAAWVTNSD